MTTLPSFLIDGQDGSITLLLLVSPRASRTKFGEVHDGRLRLYIKSPPVEGKANAEVIRFVSKLLGVSRACVTIVSGERGRRKAVRVEGITIEAILSVLGEL